MQIFTIVAATLLGLASAHPWASGVAPNATTVTESLTTYTTTTVCPVTSAIVSGKSTFLTTALTTSTVTITSCKGGCHASGTAVTPVANMTSTSSVAIPVVTTMTVPVTSTVTTFVPCSTAVFENSGTTFYSTWLTASSYVTVYKTTSCSTVLPAAATSSAPVIVKPASASLVSASSSLIVSSIHTSTSVVAPSVHTSTSVIAPSVRTTTSVIAPSVQTATSAVATHATSQSEALSCPPAETVYTTIHSTVYIPGSGSGGAAPTGKCSSCEVETCTVTLGNGYVTEIIVEYTVPATAAATKTPYIPGSSLKWSATSTSTYWRATGTGVPTGVAWPSGAAHPSGTLLKAHA